MKRLSALILTACCFLFTGISSAQVYVSPTGNDANPGTIESPKASLQAALRVLREKRRLEPGLTTPQEIFLRSGTYELYEPLTILPEDAGTVIAPTIIRPYHKTDTTERIGAFTVTSHIDKVVISGGRQISNWKKVTGNIPGLPSIVKSKLWVADVPTVNGNTWDFRQLWINDQKAVRAKSSAGETMDRILGWNKTERTCTIPYTAYAFLQNVEGVEMLIHQWWAIANLRIKKMERHGDSLKLFFHDPESRIQSEHPWPAPWISKETGNSAFYLTNALQLLDEPGEWFLDKQHRKLYYWPRNNEDLSTAKVVAPYLETLIDIKGNIDHPVSNISFSGISFQHTGWLRPSQYGHVPHQAGMYMLDAYKLKIPGTPDKKSLENQAWIGRPAAAVHAAYADHINFSICSFTAMASTGVDFEKGVSKSEIRGNLFKDIGGSGMVIGLFNDEATEVHLPYNPTDQREITREININNNLITNVTNEDWGCVGIAAGYIQDSKIEHNEIAEVGYSGISLGWGWTKTINALRNNRVAYNYIHHYGKQMYDVAAIYTLSAQPGTVIEANVIDSIYKAPYAHIPSHWFYLYTDEGSSYITVKDNWTPSQKYLQNANGPNNVWLNNGPQVHDSIRRKAGLPRGARGMKSEIVRSKQAINKHYPVIIELIGKEGFAVDETQLKFLLKVNDIDTNTIYNWQTHTVVFAKVKDAGKLKDQFQREFPYVNVKVYDDVFYEFNRSKCTDSTLATEWEHALLTVRLVEDKKMQQQYFDDHATQFEKWPEVSNGFCNASFQQLLLYRNGDQLMLVISTPKGKSLAELDPKTTENNPRVNEWNKRMSKFQRGIEGTKPGETWVFLAPVK